MEKEARNRSVINSCARLFAPVRGLLSLTPISPSSRNGGDGKKIPNNGGPTGGHRKGIGYCDEEVVKESGVGFFLGSRKSFTW